MRTLALLCVALLACADEEASLAGIQTRLFVDRTEARVGDAIHGEAHCLDGVSLGQSAALRFLSLAGRGGLS